MTFNEEETFVLQCSITTEPYIYNEYILIDSSEVTASFFNSSNHNILNVSLYCSGFIGYWYTWSSGYINSSNFEEGLYYATVCVEYDGELYFSSPSNPVFIGEEESTETSETTKSNFLFILSVLSTMVISISYLLKMRRKRKIV